MKKIISACTDIKVKYNKKIEYPLVMTENVFSLNNDNILIGGQKQGGRRFVVVDSFIYNNYKDPLHSYFDNRNIEAKIISFKAGESNKNMDSFSSLFTNLNEFQVNRRSEPIIAIGGGVTTDIVGFLASVYRRGVPHVKIPTTLMGYVDASVGIKTGINFGNDKNRMGTFEPPAGVILDKSFLKTLDSRHIINGVGEIIKLGIIKDLHLFELLESYGKSAIDSNFQKNSEDILDKSIRMMLEELEPNLYEENLSRSVDFGHTFSPAIEMNSTTELLHGEAVSIDVAFSSVISFNRNLINKGDLNRIFNLVKKLQLPYQHASLLPDLLWDSVIERTYHRDGYQRVPLPSPLGHCIFINDLKKEEVVKACKNIGEI